MSQSVPYALSSEHCYAILAAMVAEIGEPPQQDMHFDYWHYSGQHELWGFQQSYAQSIIRKFVELKGGASPLTGVVRSHGPVHGRLRTGALT